MPVLGYCFIALAAALWGSLGVISRSVLAAGVDPLELSVWRATIAGALFAVHAIARGRVRVARRDYPVLGVFAGTYPTPAPADYAAQLAQAGTTGFSLFPFENADSPTLAAYGNTIRAGTVAQPAP